ENPLRSGKESVPELLFVTDLDGTLLRNDATLSAFARTTLQQLLAEGLHFTVASARSVASIRPMLAGLDLRLPVIEFNGAFVTDLESGRHRAVCALEQEWVDQILQAGKAAGLTPCVSWFDGERDQLRIPVGANEGIDWYHRDRKSAGDPRLGDGWDRRSFAGGGVVCLTFIEREQVLAGLVSALEAWNAGRIELHLQENPYAPGWWWLTVRSRDACKSRALRHLRESICPELVGLPVVAFGDHDNDRELLLAADTGIAVANATAELRGVADQIIGSNEEDAVVRTIADLFRGGK
ncbi:MAG: HAD-IIB family hydrolase, partial [Puniceicoccaceae bacterium]